MENKSILILSIFVVILMSINIINATPEEYIEEFKNRDENCKIIDYFIYDVKCPIIFYTNRLCSTVPVFYECCNNESCVTVIFDIENEKILNNNHNKELIDLNFIKFNLNNGNLSETQFNLKGFDICSYFSNKELRQESINLAASAAQGASIFMNIDNARKVKNSVNTAKKIGVVGKFNPATLIASVSCSYDNKNLNIAMESLAYCNVFLSNIKNNYAREGYLKELAGGVDAAKTNLNIYVNSDTAQVRGIINKIINIIVGIFKFFIELDLNKSNELNIEKTELEVSQEALQQISKYNPYLKNPFNYKVLENHDLRIAQKKNQFNNKYNPFILKYTEVKKYKPSKIKIFFTNLFMNPNYKISIALEDFKDAKYSKKKSEQYFKEFKFNSAINEIENADENLESAKEIFKREINVNRKYNKLNLLLTFIFIILIVYLIYQKVLDIKYKTYHKKYLLVFS